MGADGGGPAKKAIFIVDDHPVLRLGLASLIDSEPDLDVCGEASSCEAALEAIGRQTPDLVIVDLELEGSHGLDLVKDMHRRDLRIPTLVLSMHDESLYAERALRAGARGYLTKQRLDETVLEAIRSVLAGETYMSQELTSRLARRHVGQGAPASGSPLDVLSDRELQVYRMIGHGRGTSEIAQRLHLSVKTIESHREHIKRKLGIGSAVELVRHASRWVESGRTD